MAIRITALGVPVFKTKLLAVGVNWTELPKVVDPALRAELVDYAGRFIRIHPEDVGNLGELGLELVDGKLVEAAKKSPTPTKKNGGRSRDAEKE